jgi:hypothetical protein
VSSHVSVNVKQTHIKQISGKKLLLPGIIAKTVVTISKVYKIKTHSFEVVVYGNSVIGYNKV